MQVNNTIVVDRGNRPNVSQRIGLRTFFINDGAYVDPYEISSVQLFARGATLSPSSVLGAENLVASVPRMEFGASGSWYGPATRATRPVGAVDSSSFDVSTYEPGITASGIYRVGTGDYVVVLDETLALSGWNETNATEVTVSSLSSVGDYVDLWTVKLDSASKYQVITNQFSLHEDSFFAFTEPLLLTTSNRLMNKHVRLGEKIDLKVATETTIQNQGLPQDVQNIWKDSVITSATMEIKRVNQDVHFDGPFTVSSFSESEATASTQPVTITKDNTIIMNWNTSEIKNLSSFGSGTFGSLTGTYSVQVKYTLLTETIISPLFYLTVS